MHLERSFGWSCGLDFVFACLYSVYGLLAGGCYSFLYTVSVLLSTQSRWTWFRVWFHAKVLLALGANEDPDARAAAGKDDNELLRQIALAITPSVRLAPRTAQCAVGSAMTDRSV